MTAERLYGILKSIEDFEAKRNAQRNLEAIGSALQNLVNSPAQPQYQSCPGVSDAGLRAGSAGE